MYDGHNRKINYLRVSVTDRCNFRCVYCMPTQGVNMLRHEEILTYEELLRIIRVVSHHGVSKIRLTGGEPLVRRGIIDFIRNIADLKTITDISLTTNGSLLATMATKLKAAGLTRVNISLDTIDPDQFQNITRGGDVNETIRGMEAALTAGLIPVKLNVVLTNIITERDLAYFVDLVHREPISIRFIEYMPIGESQLAAGPSIEEIKAMINAFGRGTLKPTLDIRGNGPAKYFYLPQAKGSFGFITPISDHFCGVCNRIRLTADGKFKPCLLSNQEIDVKAALRDGASDNDIVELFYNTIADKPQGHTLTNAGGETKFFRKMSQIGG
ncbi:GTP 3',8-cyclase MoaA [Sporomusa malonica]|uniref:GTP 3',8-cyclase n=2 Tax=Sporomusa malonica TaxID=112901 RepID=A0A1W2BTH8_9FIRM|nr:GTP 3',8-cyclase MoaA [Sporomusa malonica]SMC76290.1 cyclic pyranopterin phosphate synthase [Sporomusa malonica]